MASASNANNTGRPLGPLGADPVESGQEDRIDTAPLLGSSAGDTLLDWVPFEELYITLVTQACERLALVLGPRYGHYILTVILQALPRTDPRENEETLPVIERLREGDLAVLNDTLFFDWEEMSAEFANLFAFARHGTGGRATLPESRAEIEALLQHFRRFVADPGIKAALPSGFEWFVDTLGAAEARWAIDRGWPAVPNDLAALAGVKPKTIANLVAARQIPTDAQGNISAADALRYLERRKDFIRSTWQKMLSVEVSTEIATVAAALLEQVFVPVDADGNAFLPSLARRGRDGSLRYAIGEKASPEYTEDYWQALERLAQMPTPRWRRPSPSGHGGWGLVSAQDGWRRFARADLERMIAAARNGQES